MRADELLEGVELLRRADDLEDDRVRPEVRDPGAEDLGEGEQLAAPVGGRVDLEKGELALDRLAGLELVHAQDVHELVHLLLDLLDRLLGAVDAQGDARDVRALRRPDREALDVEAASREHVRHAGESARAVLDEDGKRVRHASTRSLGVELEAVRGCGARRDHREALLLGVDAGVHDRRAAAGERLLERGLELVLG